MTTTKFGIGAGVRTLIVVAVLVGGLTACGSDGDDSAGDGGLSDSETTESTDSSADTSTPDSTGTSSDTEPSTPNEDDEEYGWSIPDDDLSPAEFERDVYNGLREGCDAGQAVLDEKWYLLTFPGNVLLFQAAVHACEGSRSDAQALFDRATEHLGQPAGPGDCEVYKSLVSYLEQVPRSEVMCLDGDPTSWPSNDQGICRDDPRTSEDESLSSEGLQNDCQPAETSTTEGESPTDEEPTTTSSTSTTGAP